MEPDTVRRPPGEVHTIPTDRPSLEPNVRICDLRGEAFCLAVQ